MSENKLTKKQKAVLDFIRSYMQKSKQSPYIREIQATLKYGDKENINVFRSGGKTTLWIGHALRKFNEVYEPHLTICSPKRTRILFRNIRIPLIRNPLIRQHYGDIIDVDDGSVQASRTDKMIWYHEDIDYDHTDPAFRVASREDDIIGSRPRQIHFEDPTQQESEAGIEKLKVWYGEVVSPMLSLERDIISRETMTSTRKGMNDFSSWLLTQGWSNLHYRVIEVLEGELPSHNDIDWRYEESASGEMIKKVDKINHRGKYKLTNPFLDLDKLLEKCALDYASFMSQYQNEPISRSGRYFNNEWWTEVEPFHHTAMDKYVFTDPNHGTKDAKNDFTCSIVVLIREQTMYIIDAYVQRNLKFYEIKEIHKKLVVKHQAIQNYMHADFTEKWLVQELQREIPGVTPLTDKRNKIQRISTLDQPFKIGQIMIFNDLPYKNECKTMYLQFDQTPSNATKKDDFPDILASAYHKLKWLLFQTGQAFIGKTWTTRR